MQDVIDILSYLIDNIVIFYVHILPTLFIFTANKNQVRKTPDFFAEFNTLRVIFITYFTSFFKCFFKKNLIFFQIG